MEKNLLNKYVLDLLESLEQNFSAYTIHKKPKHIHQLRVDIKKLKAIFSFAKHIYKTKYNTIKLKPLFRNAGQIREIQINIRLLNSVHDPPEELISRLEKKENILIKQFIKKRSQYLKLIKDFKKKTSLPEILPHKKAIKEYFKSELKNADGILEHIDRGGMHKFRKKLKKILYIYNSLPKTIQKKIELNEVKINKQQKKLGNWHDTNSAIYFFSQEHFTAQTSKYIMKLVEKEKRQFNKLLISLTNIAK
ncbi:CHAD domain-containing protein [Lunatibacter salilacus]|uniref:CHAD domain-containing protein n=1 Tax=Lunatibacter salilacus TaxID=2483804 RepID=UPI00131BD4C4|nr:CHAD domain-containing protein [Lunatibacter salilacus]